MSDVLACLGQDPGNSTGMAVCKLDGLRPELVVAAMIHGPRHLWWQRAMDSASRLQSHVVDITGRDLPAFVEAVPKTFRDGSLGPGVKRGHDAWRGLGEWRGLGVGALLASGLEVHDIDQAKWVRATHTHLGRIATAKSKADAGLRVREASNLIVGARAFFEHAGAAFGAVHEDSLTAAQKRLLDAAEAMLISAAGCFLLRKHGARIPAEALKCPKRAPASTTTAAARRRRARAARGRR